MNINTLKINYWKLISAIIILLIAIPNIIIIINLFEPTTTTWEHINEYLLKNYINNTFIILSFTGIFTLIIGYSLAWLINRYDYTLKKIFKWALILPLAIPPYIGAFTYSGLLDYTGPIQVFLRNNNISVSNSFGNIMNLQGTIFIYSIFLYPYVYLILKSFFHKMPNQFIEQSKTLGKNNFITFMKVIFPLSRVAIVSSVVLVLLEVLNDFGVVKYFGIQTFSTAIYTSWFSLNDLNSAIRLSAILMLIVFLILISEKFMRRNKLYNNTNSKIKPMKTIKLKGLKNFLAFFYSLIILSLGFIIPLLQQLNWVSKIKKNIFTEELLNTTLNTLYIGVFVSITILVFSVIIANSSRISKGFSSSIFSNMTILGYSIPGAVISVGVLVFFLNLDNFVNQVFTNNTFVFASSIIMLFFAYIIRFLAIGYNSIETGFIKVGKSYFETSRTLGYGITKTFFKIDLPMIKNSLITGFILVLIEVFKELPLTLILRPFNFDTLATKAYEYASDESLYNSSIYSIIIISLGTLLIYILNIEKKKR